MSLRKPTSSGRKSISTMVFLVDGKVGNAQDLSRCVPDLLMHLGSCRYRGTPRACRLSHYIEINWVQLERGTAVVHLRRPLGRSFDRNCPQLADTILLRARVYSFRGQCTVWSRIHAFALPVRRYLHSRSDVSFPDPLCAEKRSAKRLTFVLGQTEKSGRAALPSRTDIVTAGRHVSKVPTTDMWRLLRQVRNIGDLTS